MAMTPWMVKVVQTICMVTLAEIRYWVAMVKII
jgi:hypothetical protein